MNTQPVLRICAAVCALRVTTAARLAGDDRGEGVISAAIAVLVMAFLGALMWVGFKALFTDTQSNINDQVGRVGQ